MSSPIAARMAAFAKPPAEGLEKDAGGWDYLAGRAGAGARWLGGKMGMGAKAAPRAAPRSAPSPTVGGPHVGPGPQPTPQVGVPGPPSGGGRMGFAKKFMMGTGAVGAAGAVGAPVLGHMQDNAANSPGATMNPFTWSMSGSHPSREDIFSRNNSEFTAMHDRQSRAIQDAHARGDTDGASSLQAQLDSGNYGGGERGGDWYDPTSWNSPLKWRMGGLNPFATQNASYYRDNALKMQRHNQTDLNNELARSGPQPGDSQRLEAIRQQMQSGDLLPAQATAMQAEIARLEKSLLGRPGMPNDRSEAIKKRMLGVGMRVAPGQEQQPQGTGGGNYYPVGPRQARPKPGQAGVSQHQYGGGARDPFITPFDETMQSYGNIRGQGQQG